MDQWTNSCRSCLKRAECFSHFICEHISPQQYFYCTSVEVRGDDVLPKALCDDCYNLINKFIEFKTRCIRSQSELLKLTEASLIKDEPCSDLEVKREIDIDVGMRENGNEYTAQMCLFVEVEIEHSTRQAEEVLGDINDVTGTDARDTSLEDIEDHTQATKSVVNCTTKPPKKLTVRNFTCEKCNKKFCFKERLEGHMLTAHEGKKAPILCKECNKTFTAWAGLQRHIESYHSGLSFKDVTCQVCSKVCKTPGTLRVHLRTHSERRGRVCDECGKTFKSEVTFKNHLETHTDRSRNYPCTHCGKRYINKKTCARHISRRHTDKKFICAYCDYVFTDKENLVKHIMRHEGRHRKYKCDICSKSLTSQASLTYHRRIHTGEKPFSCSHCSKSFAQKVRLVEHERNHTGEKPFECTVCSLKFSRRGSMRRHMKVHNMWEGCKRKRRY